MAARGPGRLRIVAGELGGRRLRVPAGSDLRPSAERTREAIFSILGEVEGAALDLCCGTGALGLEALSRGAASATLVDRRIGPAAANVTALGLDGDPRVELIEADAARFLARSAGAYDLVFCDPPYKLAPRFGSELDTHLPDRLRPGARVIVETSPKAPLELSLPLEVERRYGSALVRIYAVAPGSPEAGA
jgi:16S rRNA (guanine966-N2)-methyltransferase